MRPVLHEVAAGGMCGAPASASPAEDKPGAVRGRVDFCRWLANAALHGKNAAGAARRARQGRRSRGAGAVGRAVQAKDGRRGG